MGITVRPGDVIDGAYVVERLLGQGGMGAVYVAREDRLARRVAIKVLSEAHGSNPEALARFEREARSAAALQSDHAARVFSVGHLANKSPYIVMELLEGEDLAGLLARRGVLPAAEVIAMMLQVCDALSEAHALGIVHRDLKPANIFVAKRPSGATTIKVLDFGISKGLSTGATVSPLTATRAVMGTPLYMSPEQVRDVRAVDARTDVFSLGAVMYELLTGLTPFHAETLPDVFQKILDAAPRPIGDARPDVPPAFAALVTRCLEKSPAARFASAGELAQGLSAAANASAPVAPAPPPAQGSSAAETIAAQARNAYAQPIAPAQPSVPTALPAHSAPPAVTAPVAARLPTPMPMHAPSMHTPPPMHRPSTGPTPPVNPTPMPALAGTVDPLVFKTGSTTRAAAPSQPSIPLIVGVFFGVIAIAGVVVYLAVFRGGGDDKTAAASASASASALAYASASASAPASTSASASASAPATATATAAATASAPATATDPAAGAVAAKPVVPSPLGKPPPAPSAHVPAAQPPPAASTHPLPPSQPPQHPQPGTANSGTLKIPSHRTD